MTSKEAISILEMCKLVPHDYYDLSDVDVEGARDKAVEALKFMDSIEQQLEQLQPLLKEE